MSVKTSITNWIQLVKTARGNRVYANELFEKMMAAYKDVCLTAEIEENPKLPYDDNLRKVCCVAKYSLVDWKETMDDCDPGVTVHSCPFFTNTKCTQDCKMKNANNLYIDAQQAYIMARKKYINSVREVFGMKAK